jgi:1-deoxy-D-xylulose-5-phosphate reductoisomerase
VKAQLAVPDMRIPIQHALSYPERWENESFSHLDLAEVVALTFEPLDENRFPCFRLAVEAGKKGGTYSTILCTADEIAVDLFLEGRLGFTEIAELVKNVLHCHEGIEIDKPSLKEILDADSWARNFAMNWRKDNRKCYFGI